MGGVTVRDVDVSDLYFFIVLHMAATAYNATSSIVEDPTEEILIRPPDWFSIYC